MTDRQPKWIMTCQLCSTHIQIRHVSLSNTYHVRNWHTFHVRNWHIWYDYIKLYHFFLQIIMDVDVSISESSLLHSMTFRQPKWIIVLRWSFYHFVCICMTHQTHTRHTRQTKFTKTHFLRNTYFSEKNYTNQSHFFLTTLCLFLQLFHRFCSIPCIHTSNKENSEYPFFNNP